MVKTKKAAKSRTTKKEFSKKATKRNHTENKRKKRKNNSYDQYVKPSIIAAIIIILLIIIFGKGINNNSNEDVVAKFDDVIITNKELTESYNKLPADLQMIISKEQYLENLLIPQKIILKKAEIISNERLDKEYSNFLELSQQTENDLLQTLELNNITKEEFMDSLRIQIFLNDTLFDKIEVTEKDAVDFYEANKASITDENNEIIPFEEAKSDITMFLSNQKLQEETTVYLEEVKNSIEIEIFAENIKNTKTEEEATNNNENTNVELDDSSFDMTGDDLCTQDGKPIIRMFSTSWCPHCKWIKPIFEETVKKYVDEGSIVAYAWELDINDNTLTEEAEGSIPKEEMDIYQKYNPRGSIPTFVFGCKYSRIGNGYEGQSNGEAKEKADFESLIKSLITETIA